MIHTPQTFSAKYESYKQIDRLSSFYCILFQIKNVKYIGRENDF